MEKKLKRIIFILLAIGIMLFLVACSGQNNTHQHVSDGQWHADNTGNYHYQLCKICNSEINKSGHDCSGTWQNKDDSVHTGTCNICMFVKEDAHVSNGTYTTNNDTTHKTNCALCNHQMTENHSKAARWSMDTSYHWKLCTKCNHQCSKAPHQISENICSVCNYYVAPAPPIIGPL